MYLVCSVILLYDVYQGITTYDYVVAMRAMSEAAPEDEEGENIIYSPTNSATTGFSMGSSLGLHHKGAWCTPPRIFIDQVSLFALKGEYVAYKS
jgi:palmitoyltransferase ZDHHC1/11